MEGDDVVEPLSIVPSAAAPEPEGQAAGASPVRAQSSTYDRSKGVETWPEYPEEIPYHIKLIQGISNHGALEVIIIVAIVINTVTLAVQNPGNQFDYDSPWLNPFLEVLDLVLTSIFTVEMFIRIAAMGLSTDREKPYDVLFPGETVVVCNPDPMDQAITTSKQKDRVALRVKIMDSSNSERRGWISAEEQVYSSKKYAIKGCCCCKTKRKLHTINGVPILPTEEEDPDMVAMYDKDELPKKLANMCVDPRDAKEKKKVRRKQQYADLVVEEGAPRADPQLRFSAMLFKASKPHDHVGDVQRQSEKFAPGTQLKITKHCHVTRGYFGGEETEPGVANNVLEVGEGLGYAKGTPSSPADGKYLLWQWSPRGAESWTHFDEKSSELLTDAKEGIEPHAQPNRDGEVELKETDGFGLVGLAEEDYMFNPSKVRVATGGWEGVMHTLVNKQTRKEFDVRLIAIDIAYLSDAWNRLDFFVVITSWATVILEAAEVALPFKTSSLRALRVMRVLRSMRFFSGIKTILSVLGQSVPKMGNIVGFLLFVYCILGIVGVQMFRGRLMYRCSHSFPEPDATGWDYQWMGIGDPNGPTDVFPDSPYCFPGDHAVDSPAWINVCQDECHYPNTTIPISGLVLPSRSPKVPNTPWEPTAIFNRLDRDDDESIGVLTQDEVAAMLGFMGVDAPRSPVLSNIEAAEVAMRGGAASIRLAEFGAWWNQTLPCMPCWEAPSCRAEADDASGAPHRCYHFGNPGFGIHGFDHIVMSWHTIFIMMTNLYWWETAYQIEDVQGGLGSAISWLFGLIVVFMLSWVTVNMFVAVICDTFSSVLAQQAKFDGEDEEEEEDDLVVESATIRTEQPLAAVPVAMVSHDLMQPKTEEQEDDQLTKQKKQQQQIDKNKKKLYLEIEGKLNDDGSQWSVEMTLANPRPSYVNCLYKPNKEGIGDGKWWCPSKLMLHPLFDNGIMCFILANTVTLAMEHTSGPPEHLMSEGLTDVLANLGHVFNAVFIFEMVTKILGMGYLNYLSVAFNQLDHFIVFTSILNYMGDLLPGASAARLLRIFRLFRIAKVIRILYKYQSIKRLLDTVAGAGTMLANLTLFILFVVTVFAIMGMHLMGDNIHSCSRSYPADSEHFNQEFPNRTTCEGSAQDGNDFSAFCSVALADGSALRAGRTSEVTCAEEFCADCQYAHFCDYSCNFPCYCAMLDEDVNGGNGELQRRNYENIARSWLMAFQTLTGDDWCNQMYAYLNIFGWPSAIFYAVVFIFNNYVLMNLFIAVILEGFAIENAAKEAKQADESRKERENVIKGEMFEEKEENKAPKQRWTFQVEGTKEYPDSMAEADITRVEVAAPDGIQVRVTYRGSKQEKDKRMVDLKPAEGGYAQREKPDRITYEAYIAKEKRWNDTTIMVTKKSKVAGAVQSMKAFADGVSSRLKTDAEIRETCNMPPKEDLIMQEYTGCRVKRPTGYHSPDEPKLMDAATRTLWNAFDRVSDPECRGTMGQLLWELGFKELTDEIEADACAAVLKIKEGAASSSSPGALATPSGPAGERSGSPISNGELVKNLGFDNIRIWWQQKESVGDDPCEKGGFQIMVEAQKNEKEAKELTSLRDMMLTSQHDGGAVFDAQEECKLQQGFDNSSMFDNADDNDDTGLSQEEMKKLFTDAKITEADPEETFKLINADGSGRISRKEFEDWIVSADPVATKLRESKMAHSPWTLPLGMELIQLVGGKIEEIERAKQDIVEFEKQQQERPVVDAVPPSPSMWVKVLREYEGLGVLLKDTKHKLMLEEPREADVRALSEYEEYSMPIRKLAERIAINPWFERTVMIAIIVSSVLLAMEGPQDSLRSYVRNPALNGTWESEDVRKACDNGAACDGYEKNDAEVLLGIVDTVFYGVFLFEFFTKLIAYGFWNTPNAYIKDPWNKLDFVVVVFSTVNYLPGQSKSSLGRIFRLGRCLRPLRMINKFPSLQVIVAAIVDSLGTNTAVLGLSFMLFLIFGILGVNIFGGKFYFCTCGDVVGPDVWDAKAFDSGGIFRESTDPLINGTVVGPFARTGEDDYGGWGELVRACDVNGDELWTEGIDATLFGGAYPYRNPTDQGKRDSPAEWKLVEWNEMNDRMLCEAQPAENGCAWVNKPYHFDNIKDAIFGMFTASTLAGWTDLMECSLDVSGFDKQPVAYNAPYFAVYWVLFVFLLAFFITNLFLGVLIDFIAEADGSALTTDEQQEWTDLQRNTKSAMPPIEVLRSPEHPVRLFCYNLTADPRKSAAWSMLGNIAIGANVLVMMLEYEGQPASYETTLDKINLGFLIFFTVDMFLKWIGLGTDMYLLDPWNKFDFIVVSISWIGDIVGFKASVARAFRAFRIALILKGAKGLQALFRTLINAVKPSINISALLFLLFSLYAILGMQIFGKAPLYIRLHEFGQVQQNRQSNFHSYFEAMKLLFECSAGKDWKIVMYEVEEETGQGIAFAYFFTFFFFAVYILTNMFVAVIIDEFGACQREGGLSISLDNMIVFQKVWRAHALIHESEHAIKIKSGKNKVNIRQILKDVGLFTGQEQESEKLDREHREEMQKYDEATDLSEKQLHYAKAEELLTRLRVVESDLFREGLQREHDAALKAKSYAAADDAMKKLLKLDEDIMELKGNSLAPSCELVLKTGGGKEAVMSQFVKKAGERDLGTHREIIKRQDANARKEERKPREVIDGVNITPEDLKKFDSGTLVPHPEWENEEMTPEQEESAAVLAWKPGEVHPLWEEWYKGVLLKLREREREHPCTPAGSLLGALFGTSEADDAGTMQEAEIEVHYLAVLEAVLLESMEKAGNANPDKDKKMEMLKEATKKSMKLTTQRIKMIQDPYTGVNGAPDDGPAAAAAVSGGETVLPGQMPRSPGDPPKRQAASSGVKVVEWVVGTEREDRLEKLSRKPELQDDPDCKGRTSAATWEASTSWQKRGVRVRTQPMDAAIKAAGQLFATPRESLDKPNFAKELTEKGLARRIPGVPDGCRHWVGEVSSEACGTRMVLFLRAAGEGCMQAIRDINVADEVLQWCQEKLPQHQVPAAVVAIEAPEDSVEGDGAAALEAAAKGINMAKLFAPQDQSWAYPWELHSLLSAPGWHLQEADTASDTADYDTLDEDEVLILKEAFLLIDPYDKRENGTRTRTGFITTQEFFIALKLTGLYAIPPDGTDEYKVWEDRVWQASQERLGNEQKEYQDDADREVAEVYHLADIDRDKQGIVTIDWPEFLEIVAKLQNPRKCRGGKAGLVRLRTDASRPSSSSS